MQGNRHAIGDKISLFPKAYFLLFLLFLFSSDSSYIFETEQYFLLWRPAEESHVGKDVESGRHALGKERISKGFTRLQMLTSKCFGVNKDPNHGYHMKDLFDCS